MSQFAEQIPKSEYANLLRCGIPLIDLRAPIEFNKGAFPTAINLPLMTDQEREQVGTCYKNQGQQAAIELGHQLVHGVTKQARVDAWRTAVQQQPDTLLYCFRGGLRSQLSQQWLSEAGIDRPYIEGGYKGLRSFLLQQIELVAAQGQIVILGGMTGCGKTDVLIQQPGHLDLEGLAQHRGSSFGRTPAGQPSQINFENQLAILLLQQRGPLLLEDESRLIGRLALPLSLYQRMTQTPRIILEVSLSDRIQQITKDYVINLHQAYQDFCGLEHSWQQFTEHLHGAMYRVRKRLGSERYQKLDQALSFALVQQQQHGDVASHASWIEPLLNDYYDPMYRYQLSQQTAPILYQGNPDEVSAWWQDYRTKQPHLLGMDR